MSFKRITLIAALALLTVIPAEAQKRRAVAAPGGNFTPPASNCHEFGLVKAGLVASYHADAQGGGADFEITYISDTPTQLKTRQKTVTAQGTANAETTVDGEVVGNLRALKHINVKVTTAVPGFGNFTIETDIDFVPSLVAGPAAGWCVGNKWTVPPVTETIVVRGGPAGTITNTVTTIASEGEVLAVGEMVSVPAGDFRTVKYIGVVVAGSDPQPAITWVSMDHNIVVKQDTLDATGKVTSVTELVQLSGT
jgi:hypothetical protein